jgi:putative flippase GtrA
MRIVRDGAGFSLVGAVQIVVDSCVYILLTTLGVATPPSNVCGRIAGALLGFWLNGRLTFAHHEQPHLRRRLMRYAILWTVTTTISTLALMTIGAHAGLRHTWWAKPLIETALGVTSFLTCRHWVYRR